MKNQLHLHSKCHTSIVAALGIHMKPRKGKARVGVCSLTRGGVHTIAPKPQAQKSFTEKKPAC